MSKGRKFIGKKKNYKNTATKKKKKLAKEGDVINKKSLFNRYKDKQKVEEAKLKKEQLERKFMNEQVAYSESEEDEDPFHQLVSCFSSTMRQTRVADSASGSEDDLTGDSSDAEMCDGAIQGKENDVDIKDDKNAPNNMSEEELDDEEEAEIPEVTEEVDADNDPFTKHLQYELSDNLVISLTSDPPKIEHTKKHWNALRNLIISVPKPVEINVNKTKPKFSILEEKVYSGTGTVPIPFSKIDMKQMFIKSQIHGTMVSANKTNLIKRDLELTEVLTPLQKELFSIINNYQDLLYPERTFSNAEEIRYIYCLHVVNHMLKTRMKIIHHNAKLAKKSDVTDEYRDQGLVRPKVLILVPFKDAAYRIVKTLIDIVVPAEAGQVVNKKRFEGDFTGGDLLMPKKNPKPEDYELLFSGNTEDTFRVGMTLTKKTLKLYTDFYASDIIIASPLGLRMIVGAEGEEGRDYDFLASVELLVLDQADVFLMQNWDHLLHVLDHFHLQPKKTHGTDYSRVRPWAVNGWAKYYRQTLMFSSVLLPEMKNVINKKCYNYAGKVIVSNPVETGSIQQIVLQVPQMFHRFNSENPLQAAEARFQYFIKEVLPKHRDTLMSHTLIYVPSYFDFVRIRNYFKKEDISFVQICEYSKDAKIARARDMFFHTEAHFLLYSERVHFFRRFRVKGIRHIIFYQPPIFPHFYSEMCNLMQESNQNRFGGSECNMSVSVLYSRYDLAPLAAVLGARRAARVAQADQPVHMYLTGE